MSLEQIGYDSPEGHIAYGVHKEVIAGGSTKTLVAKDAGALVLLDQADGSVITLPTPVAGMTFTFGVSVSVTSNSHIITVADTSTQFLAGAITMVIDTSATSEGQLLNGTTHVTLTMNGTTTGGLKGTYLVFTAISSTVWFVSGIVGGSGTLATPATT